MNRYTPLLHNTDAEIESFASGPDGALCGSSWYSEVKRLVQRVKEAQDDLEAEKFLDMVLWSIVDNGPLGRGFSPSIELAADAMQRKRKREFKELRLRRKKDGL